ncbi:MAG: LuxR C-terminal-related transcriptional regulator [Candidatus Yanofskybacteria bacterium]|nr:LuxR C-terminal-related transcriptional regulator [Candidatus Yanofskybacteria bacterium]
MSDIRDIRILALTAEGLKVAEIAQSVKLSPDQVSRIRRELYNGYGVHDPISLVITAIERGEIPLPSLPAVNGVSLTPRQQKILDWICQGKTNEEVAQEIGLAAVTVRRRLMGILYRALGISSCRMTAALIWWFKMKKEVKARAKVA